MALNINLLPLLLRTPPIAGSILTLGVQRPLFTSEQMARVLKTNDAENVLDQTDVFRALGYDCVESLDVSGYEGAKYIFDLNGVTSPPHLVGAFDVVFTGGTLEHVFHVSHAVQHAARFVKPGGFLIHLGPVNNWINHGFYQICPTLFLDYLVVNEWLISESLLIDVLTRKPSHWRLKATNRKVRPEGIRQLHYVVAQKIGSATTERVPHQQIYKIKHGKGDSKDKVSPNAVQFDLIEGEEQ